MRSNFLKHSLAGLILSTALCGTAWAEDVFLMDGVTPSSKDTTLVPAGTFKNCARVVGNGSLPLYADAVQGFKDVPVQNIEWYCKGVGLVKVERQEDIVSPLWSSGKIVMELTDFKIP